MMRFKWLVCFINKKRQKLKRTNPKIKWTSILLLRNKTINPLSFHQWKKPSYEIKINLSKIQIRALRLITQEHNKKPAFNYNYFSLKKNTIILNIQITQETYYIEKVWKIERLSYFQSEKKGRNFKN